MAGMKKYIEQNKIKGQTMVAITSGANMDFNRLRFVSERADGSERTMAVTIPEEPGAFRALYALIWPRNVTEFSYRYECDSDAHVLVSIQPDVKKENDFDDVLANVQESGFECVDVTDNELAKVHARHLAGGRSDVTQERLFRLEFPESPGALQRFLESLDMEWNITLFHYRNHGDDFGRVLVGIQVAKEADHELSEFMDTLDYKYEEETENPVNHLFLRR